MTHSLTHSLTGEGAKRYYRTKKKTVWFLHWRGGERPLGLLEKKHQCWGCYTSLKTKECEETFVSLCSHTITLGVAILSPSITGVWPLLQLPPSSNRRRGKSSDGICLVEKILQKEPQFQSNGKQQGDRVKGVLGNGWEWKYQDVYKWV